jgi:hypothetical protein
MGRPTNSAYRQKWYALKMKQAASPKEQFEILRGKLAASVLKLPEDLQDGAYANAVDALSSAIEAIEDAMDDVRPVNA